MLHFKFCAVRQTAFTWGCRKKIFPYRRPKKCHTRLLAAAEPLVPASADWLPSSPLSPPPPRPPARHLEVASLERVNDSCWRARLCACVRACAHACAYIPQVSKSTRPQIDRNRAPPGRSRAITQSARGGFLLYAAAV